MIPQQTGEELTRNESDRLLAQCQKVVEQYGLGTAAMEVLTAWVSTETANPSPNSARQLETLRDGLKGLPTIMSDDAVNQIGFLIMAGSKPNVQRATVGKTRNGIFKYTVHTGG